MKLANLCIFSVRHITPFLYLGTLGSTSALSFGAILNNITKKNHKIWKMWHEVGCKKDFCSQCVSWLRWEGSVALFDLSGEHVWWVIQIFAALYTPAEEKKAALQVLISVLEINFSESVNSHIRICA